MCLSRHSLQCSFQTNGVTLPQTVKFNLEVTFSSDGRQGKKLDKCVGKVSAVMRQFYRSVVQKQSYLFSDRFLFLSPPMVTSVGS